LHLERCQQVLSKAEDWRGLRGRVALAQAVAVGAKGMLDAAARQFDIALAVFHEYCLPWSEAEALYLWGRMLLAAGDRAAAAAKLDLSADTYRQRGAEERWLQRVVTLRPSKAARESRGTREPSAHPGGLSDREVQVLCLVAAGRSNREIGEELFISLNTVDRHVSHIFAKTGAANRAEAAGYAYRNGLAD